VPQGDRSRELGTKTFAGACGARNGCRRMVGSPHGPNRTTPAPSHHNAERATLRHTAQWTLDVLATRCHIDLEDNETEGTQPRNTKARRSPQRPETADPQRDTKGNARDDRAPGKHDPRRKPRVRWHNPTKD